MKRHDSAKAFHDRMARRKAERAAAAERLKASAEAAERNAKKYGAESIVALHAMVAMFGRDAGVVR